MLHDWLAIHSYDEERNHNKQIYIHYRVLGR